MWFDTKRKTKTKTNRVLVPAYLFVTLVEYLRCQQLQWTTVYTAFRFKKSPHRMVCFTGVCWARMKNDSSRLGSGIWIPVSRQSQVGDFPQILHAIQMWIDLTYMF